MSHPTEGALRRALDDPASLPDADTRHVQQCTRCAAAVEAARNDRAVADQRLEPERSDPVDVDRAWQRLVSSLAEPGAAAAPMSAGDPPSRARRGRGRGAALAAAGALIVVGGATAAAANDWVTIFHTETVVPVTVPASLAVDDIVQLPDLSAFGRWQSATVPRLVPVNDAAAAQRRTGLAVPTLPTTLDLPTGVTGEPRYEVVPRQTAVFTFSRQAAVRAATQLGQSLPPLPPGLEGTELRLQAGPAVVMTWTQDSGLPTMLVARAVAPSAATNGVALDTVRDALLSLPGVSPALAAQLRAVTGDGSTLPLPVPQDRFTTTSADVSGHQATVLTARDATVTAVVWVDDGMLTVVAGQLRSDELLTVARGLS